MSTEYEIVGYVGSGSSAVPIKKYPAMPAQGYAPVQCSVSSKELDDLEEEIEALQGLTTERVACLNALRRMRGG